MNVREIARGKWRGILMALNVDQRYLKHTHGPCPFCEGTDRYRFDDKDGRGTFFCSHCGSGDGFTFLKRLYGWEFRESATRIETVIGGITRVDKARGQMPEKDRRDMMRQMWGGATPLTGEDPASLYLKGRDVLPDKLPICLRYHPNCRMPNGGSLPAMIALVQDPKGYCASLHRTFLGPNGKADIDTPRALVAGGVEDGSAIRLYPVHGERIGIAEGIETAIAAAKRFRLPVWSAINATMLRKWVPPENVTHVTIFGDNDQSFGGQAAAYDLAHKLVTRHKVDVTVSIPETIGKDWADAVTA